MLPRICHKLKPFAFHSLYSQNFIYNYSEVPPILSPVTNSQLKSSSVNNPKLKQEPNLSEYFGEKGYGYYNWESPSSYCEAITSQYFLDDLIIGFRHLKRTNALNKEENIRFALYVVELFPKYEEEIFETIVPVILKLEESKEYHERKTLYLEYLIRICCNYQRRKIGVMDSQTQKEDLKDIAKRFDIVFRRRLSLESNCKDFDSVFESICQHTYDYMGNLESYFDVYMNVICREIAEKRYKISPQTVNKMMFCYSKLITSDYRVANFPMISKLPQIYQEDEETFQNLILILPEFFNYDSNKIVKSRDIEKLHKSIAACVNFKSKETKNLLRRYSEHLVLLGQVELVEFTNLLDGI